jgi:Cu+-exporting ATPase
MSQTYFAQSNSGHQVLAISGMTCSGCVATVERVLSRVPGVTHAHVDFSNRHASITGSATADDLFIALEAAGYSASPPSQNTAGKEFSVEQRRNACC